MISFPSLPLGAAQLNHEPDFYLKWISCIFIAIGMGWTFGEVRRIFFHPGDVLLEAQYRRGHGHWISLVWGVAYLFGGAVMASGAFGRGVLPLSFDFPYVQNTPEGRQFLVMFAVGAGGWAILSGVSTRILPPPLFPESVIFWFCRIVRTILYVLLAGAVVLACRGLRGEWTSICIGIVIFLLAFVSIHSGELWRGTWRLRPVTLEERPFPYLAGVLLYIGLVYIYALALGAK